MLYILWESEKGLDYILHEYFTNHDIYGSQEGAVLGVPN